MSPLCQDSPYRSARFQLWLTLHALVAGTVLYGLCRFFGPETNWLAAMLTIFIMDQAILAILTGAIVLSPASLRPKLKSLRGHVMDAMLIALG